MKATVDAAGRVLIPKTLRDRLGLTPGSTVDISEYGEGLHIVAGQRGIARLVEENGLLVAVGMDPMDDETLFALIDAGRR